jgi:hypothetical protein
METITAYMAANPSVGTFLSNPTMEAPQKKDVLAKLGKEADFHPFTKNFLNLLVDKKRIGNIEEIAEEFESLYCDSTDTQVRLLLGLRFFFAVVFVIARAGGTERAPCRARVRRRFDADDALARSSQPRGARPRARRRRVARVAPRRDRSSAASSYPLARRLEADADRRFPLPSPSRLRSRP